MDKNTILFSKITLAQEKMNCLSKIIDPNKNTKMTHYKPLLWVYINGRLRKARLN